MSRVDSSGGICIEQKWNELVNLSSARAHLATQVWSDTGGTHLAPARTGVS